MARALVTHRPNWAGIDAVVRGPPITRDLQARGRAVQAAARRLVGVDSGRLRDSIRVQTRQGARGPEVTVGTRVPYAWVHHQGHGWIYPHPPHRFLRFVPKGSGRVVYARRVRPVAGTYFLRRALQAARR